MRSCAFFATMLSQRGLHAPGDRLRRCESCMDVAFAGDRLRGTLRRAAAVDYSVRACALVPVPLRRPLLDQRRAG